MKCKKAGTDFVFICMENQSDICNIMPVRDMGYQYVKYTDQIKLWQKKNKKSKGKGNLDASVESASEG